MFSLIYRSLFVRRFWCVTFVLSLFVPHHFESLGRASWLWQFLDIFTYIFVTEPACQKVLFLTHENRNQTAFMKSEQGFKIQLNDMSPI